MSEDVDASAEKGPKQARSKARRQAMIEYGAELFETRNLDDVSIAEITQALGYSTGSFYSYFADKAELFVAIQTWVSGMQNARLGIEVSPGQIEAMDLNERLRFCIEFTLVYFRKHTGLIRGALRHERRIPEVWSPNRRTTTLIVAVTVRGLSLGERSRLEKAMQMAFGLLINAVLRDPGPMRLHDADLADNICSILNPYLTSSESAS